ncbi:MAG TPA: polyphosphate kinase 1 [Longimicrobiaceae bacterium]|nr:polyphosphate kinase 1 [Longimicrobiaceae bacterium]
MRFEVSGRGALERLAAAELPGVGPAAPPVFFRDVYYDTPDGDLGRRGATVCVRHREDGEKELEVDVRAADPPAEVDPGAPRRAAIQVPDVDPAELFAGLSEPARLLRALVDPARLVPWLEIETRRVPRPPAAEGGPALGCDGHTVRDRDLSAELATVELRPGADDPATLVRRLEEEFGAVPVDDLYRRARRSLAEGEVDWLEEAVRAARRVAVVPWADGRVGVLREGGGVRIPTGAGTGEDACRQVLRALLEHGGGRVRLLGTGTGTPHQPATEVWLAEVDAAAPAWGAGRLEGVALGELLEAVGSPALRDGATLAALHVLARSGLPTAPSGEPPALTGSGTVLSAAALPGEAAAERVDPDALPPGTLLNMELSVLAFNRRVLDLAEDPRTPLLERVRFLSIFGANLDEFFRVRVAGFKRQVAEESDKPTIDGVTAQEQLDAIGVRARALMDRAYALLFETLLPGLRGHGIELAAPGELDGKERAALEEHFHHQVHPVLTPLAAGPGHPFPHIRNLRPALAAVLREPATGTERLAVVELPDGLPRFVRLPGTGRFVPLEDVVRESLPRLYPGMEVEDACAFRVTRSAELHLEATPGRDLLQAVEEEVRRRRFRPVVRIEVEACMPERVRRMLVRELQFEAPEGVSALGEGDVYAVERLIDLRGLRELAAVEGVPPELRYPPAEPAAVLDPSRPIFELLREREVLVYFPEDSFEATVERFVVEAADDPDVLAIKLALYRTNKRSRIVEAMRRASARGKQVVALVELTARFDEQRNIEWARYLSASGIHVIYGVPGLKIHAKIALVVRREPPVVRRYVYIGTGNLNATTAAAYTDLGLLSADAELGAELNDLFNVLTGYSGPGEYRRLLVAPYNLRRRFVEMIDREAEHARAGLGGHIRAKFNGLADREVIAALYRASQAGVAVELVVRGLCALRPGVAGFSENIRVVSILGRYLEHARIFRFANGGEPEYYIGSADWRTRNLSKRVEVAAPVRDPEHRARLDALLEAQIESPDAWELGSDGTYYKRPAPAPRDATLPADPERVPFVMT